MEKNTTGLKKCANNELDSDDRAHYKISRRSFLGSSALVVLPALCAGCPGSDGPAPIDLPDVVNNKIVIPLAEFPELMKIGGSVPLAILESKIDRWIAERKARLGKPG